MFGLYSLQLFFCHPHIEDEFFSQQIIFIDPSFFSL